MDGLQNLSQDLFTRQKFSHPDRNRVFDIFETSGDGLQRSSKIPEDRLEKWIHGLCDTPVANTARSKSGARIGLVCVPRELDVSLGVSRSVFWGLLDAMQVHRAALYMVARDYDGFHEFQESRTGSEGNSLPTWFAGTPLFALLWTFDSSTSRTLAVFFNRRRDTFPDFTRYVDAFKRYASSPQLLSFVICVHQLHTFDEDNAQFSLNTIREVEKHTGHQPHKDAFDDPRQGTTDDFDVDRVTEWTRVVGVIAGDARSKIRHQSICSGILKDIEELAGGHETKRKCDAAAVGDPDREESLVALGRAVPAVRRQIATSSEYLAYLEYRAERLSEVVGSNLLLEILRLCLFL